MLGKLSVRFYVVKRSEILFDLAIISRMWVKDVSQEHLVAIIFVESLSRLKLWKVDVYCTI